MHAALALVPRVDREIVKARADRLADDLWRWGLAAGGRFDRGLADRLAMVVAAIAPDLDARDLALLARYSLWTFWLDDRLDDPTADPAELDTFVDRMTKLAEGASAAEVPLLGRTLLQLRTALRAYGRDELVLARFTAALCDAMRAGAEHTVRSVLIRHGRADPPTAAEYLAVASRHVNYRSFAYALTLLVSRGPVGEFIEQIDAALVPACRAVRLANDLRTIDSDLAAGRLNILVLRHTNGTAVQAASIERQIDNDVRLHGRLLRKIRDSAAQPCVAALENSLRMAIGIYRVTDLR